MECSKERYKKNYKEVLERLHQLAEQYSKPCPQLVVVSKKKAKEDILACVSATAHQDFGENYASELREKSEWFLQNHPRQKIIWHFIGQLQTNNLSMIARHASVVHTLYKQKHAEKLSVLAQKHQKSIDVYLQLKVDSSKPSGGSKEDVLTLAQSVTELEGLHLKGLMVFPPVTYQDDLMQERPPLAYQGFRGFADLIGEKKLSLGTSSDLAMSVSAGTSLVRVGRAILGER